MCWHLEVIIGKGDGGRIEGLLMKVLNAIKGTNSAMFNGSIKGTDWCQYVRLECVTEHAHEKLSKNSKTD